MKTNTLIKCALFLAVSLVIGMHDTYALTKSSKVALVPNASGRYNNGGVLPTSNFGGGFAPTFVNVTVESIRDNATDPLAAGGYDTVVLVGICDINSFLSNSQFKSRIEGFVFQGGKLIVWDSECTGTNYSKFIFPFTTSNPGAMGATGTLTDVEENTLSSKITSSANYINTSYISTQTDAVGDANVMVTKDPNWCIDMTAKNYYGVTGPVQTYAQSGLGLIIYAGLDKDVLYSGQAIGTANGTQNLGKMWMLELIQAWNPVPLDPQTGKSVLPCLVPVVGLQLTPETATNPVNKYHTLTAKAVNQLGNPLPGITVTFTVKAGPHAGTGGTAVTDSSGQAIFSYKGIYAGVDSIEASATVSGSAVKSKTVTNEWILALTDVKVIDTISNANITLDQLSISPAPYSITPSGTSTIIEWRYDYIAPGQIQNLSFYVNFLNPIPGEDRLVDQKLGVYYTDVNGNPAQDELGPQYVHVLNSAFDNSISTDKPVYEANEGVLLNATVKSLSEYARTLDAKIVIEDSQGASVKEIAAFSNVSFGAGETRNFNNLVFNTGVNFAADYKAHLILYENQKQVGESFAGFKIQATIIANTTVTTDKTAYNANEPVTIASRVKNASPNYIFQDLPAKVSLLDRQGRVLFTDSKIITMLAQGGVSEFKSYWNTSTNPKGIYTVKLEVFDGVSAISTSQTSFEILGSSQTGAGLTGAVTAAPNPVYHGKDNETITYSISNGGNEDLSDVQASILIIDPDTQELKVQYNALWTIIGGATVNGVQVVPTGLLRPKVYLAVLRAKTSMMAETKTIVGAPFEVQLGVDVAKTIPDIQRVLVWLNYPCASGETSPNCPDQARVEQALKDSGITYAIVNNRDDFSAALSNAIYTDYAILGDTADLDDVASETLRKKVFGGKGLLSSLYHRENLDQAVFGLAFQQYLPGQDYMLELQQNEAGLSSFASVGRGSSINALNPADTKAWIVESPDVKDPGVIKQAYGRGQGLYVGIDLGLSSSGDSQQYAALMKYLLTAAHTPIDPAAVPPRELVPVEVKLTNQGGAIDLRLVETYPAEVKIMDSASKTWPTDNPWTRLTHLDADAAQSLLYYVLTPDASGPLALWTEAAYLDGGLYTPFKNVSAEIGVSSSFYTGTIDVSLMPFSSTADVGKTHQVTATVTNLLNEPQSGMTLTFNVISGPNQETAGVCSADSGCRTDADGRVTFSYVGSGGAGIDKIQACYASQDPTAGTVCSQVVTQEWTGSSINLGRACGGAVVGLQGTKIVNSLVTIYGDEYVSQSGSLANNAPSTINGNVYEFATRQYSGPGKLNGSIVTDPTLLNQVDADALSAAATAKALVPTRTFENISSPTTVTGNGGVNVIQINGNITSSLILSGNASDVFIINVTGNLNIGGSSVLGVAGNVAPGNVLYNFIGTGGTIDTHVDNVVNGTLLAPKYSFNLDGVFNGRIIGGGSSISLLSGAIVNRPTYPPCP